MEGRAHRQQDCALGAARLGDLDGALDRRPVARDDDLAGAVVVGRLADLAFGGLLGDLPRGLEVEADQRRHGADADRHGLLHGAAANAEKPGGVGKAEAAGGGQRRVFAERMAGDVGDGFAQGRRPWPRAREPRRC